MRHPILLLAAFAVAPLQAMEVWNASPVDQVKADAQPVAGPAVIDIAAPRNGVASGQVVVSANAPVHGVIDGLSGPGGKIPGAVITVRYGTAVNDLSGRTDIEPGRFGWCDGLSPSPLPGQQVQPVWVTVAVPAATAPGIYEGSVAISGGGSSATVPVKLTVSPMLMPDRNKVRMWIGLDQSITSLSDRYAVPVYSDEHFRLLDTSLRMMGQIGQHVLYVPVIEEDFSGVQRGLITFERKGGKLVPDYSALDRYAALHIKYCGIPRAVVVELWQTYMLVRPGDKKSKIRDATQAVLSVRAGTGFETATMPLYPAEDAFWTDLWKGALEHLTKLGIARSAIHIGLYNDRHPDQAQVAFWNQADPAITWAGYTHGYGGFRPAGTRTVYCESPDLYFAGFKLPVRGMGDPAQGRTSPVRDMNNDSTPPLQIRRLPDLATGGGVEGGRSVGLSRLGFDSWTVLPAGAKKPVNHMNPNDELHSKAFRLIRGNTRSFTMPGPAGALATQRYEMLREGVQDCEARLIIERAYTAGKLEAALKTEAEAVLTSWNGDYLGKGKDDKTPLLDRISVDWQKRVRSLYDLAGRIQAAP